MSPLRLILAIGLVLITGMCSSASAQEFPQSVATEYPRSGDQVNHQTPLVTAKRIGLPSPDSLRIRLEAYVQQHSARGRESGLLQMLDVFKVDNAQDLHERVGQPPVAIPSFARFDVARRADDYCEYTDPWEEYTEGECATQEDADTATVIGLGLEADLVSLEDDIYEAIDEECDNLLQVIEPDPEEEEFIEEYCDANSPEPAAKASDVPYSPDTNMFRMEYQGHLASPGRAVYRRQNCVGEAILSLSGLSWFGAQGLSFWEVVAGVGTEHVTKVAITAATGAYAAAALAAVGAGYILIECVAGS